MFCFYIPPKKVRLISGGIEMEHWAKLDLKILQSTKAHFY